MSFQHFLYKHLRCELAHEATVPTDIEIARTPVPDIGVFPVNNKLVIDPNVIVALSEAVLQAPENDSEFPLPAAEYISYEI